jgi:hypothetical protein
MFMVFMVTVLCGRDACIYHAATLCIYRTTQCNITADNWLCSYCYDKVTLHSVCNGFNWLSFVKHCIGVHYSRRFLD